MANDSTSDYERKRDLAGSGEPRGRARRARRRGAPRFVVQRHDASTLHYDLRLEIEGVLVSWAVPKGPSLDPRVRRLAVRTEDHPLEYADFEGVIPEGHYGAGSVIVWDRGSFANLREGEDAAEPASLAESLAQGRIEVALDGEKLRGGFALVRTGRGKQERWLLVKMRGAGADARRRPTSTQPESVLTGRTTEDVAREAGDASSRARRRGG